MNKPETPRNTEFRNIPGVNKNIKVSRDGEVKWDDVEVENHNNTITDLEKNNMTLQMAIHKAFPDIPMRITPTR